MTIHHSQKLTPCQLAALQQMVTTPHRIYSLMLDPRRDGRDGLCKIVTVRGARLTVAFSDEAITLTGPVGQAHHFGIAAQPAEHPVHPDADSDAARLLSRWLDS